MMLTHPFAYTCIGAVIALGNASEIANKQRQLRLRGGGEDSGVFDCSVGCPMDDRNLVCSDGITFQNECFALCQGKVSISQGPCDDGSKMDFLLRQETLEISLESLSAEGVAPTAMVTADTMTQYYEENYVFIGCIAMSRNFRPETPDSVVDITEEETHENHDTTDYASFRVTFDGFAYISNTIGTIRAGEDPHVNITTIDEKKGGEGQIKKGGSRKLNDEKRPKQRNPGQRELQDNTTSHVTQETVIHLDTRYPVSDTRVDPYKKIVEFDYDDLSGEGGCSGVVVGKNSVMTAAHCVYSSGANKWYQVSQVSPGRYRSDDGESINPFGVFEAQDATFYAKYVNGWYPRKTHDVAIVRLKPNRFGSIGDVVGTTPMKTYPCQVPSDSHITGYAGDKDDAEMNTSGPCDAWKHDCNDLQIDHKCDTYKGTSGAPMMDSNGTAFGVHTHGFDPIVDQWNSGVSLSQVHIKNLRRWIR